ncbi:unnamed protein product [Amoebophrya sp. A120]|nr:unnamed protein product [Amoebophrya sp. A120]|eukprot:GSA120T00015334001.1
MVVHKHNGVHADHERQSPHSEDEFFEDPAEQEGVDETRLRIAKEYLRTIAGTDSNSIGKRKRVAEDFDKPQVADATFQLDTPIFFPRGHQGTCTSACVRRDQTRVYSGGKDCVVYEWDVESRKKVRFSGSPRDFACGGHHAEVLDVAFCEALQLLVSVGGDSLVRVWDPRVFTNRCIRELAGHQRGARITGVVVDGTNVFTTGTDKLVKLWDLQHFACLDTYLGHTEAVTCIDLNQTSRPITGSADKSARLWKTTQDSHLLFAKHTSSVDAVCALQSSAYASGGMDGHLHLWSAESSKPKASFENAHGGMWISSLGCVRHSNYLLSGSSDGYLRSWKIREKSAGVTGDDVIKQQKLDSGAATACNGRRNKSVQTKQTLVPQEAIPVAGVVNQIVESESFFICAVGKEPRLGRWETLRSCKNGICLVRKRHD